MIYRKVKSPKKLIYPPEGGTYYDCNYTINKKKIKRLIISNHYKKKHSKYMSDKLIIKFIEECLNNQTFYNGKEKGKWIYFELEPILYDEKEYKLIWLINKDIADFLGVVNCCYSNVKLINDHEKK